MKKRFLNILIAAILSGLIFACCSDARKEKKESEEKSEKSAEEVACTDAKANESEELSGDKEVLADDYLKDFEERAIQKVQDFASYLEIISDSTIDVYLREQTIIQAIEFFDESQKSFAEELLKQVLQSKKQISAGLISNFRITEPFVKDEENTYKATISFSSRISFPISTTFSNKPIEYTAKIHLKQVEKDFGGEKEPVWEVLFGEIKVAE